ncbi:MAG: LLM class flavin-dependent oxidoreductase [Candidatus Tectomicrobia bacterium]|uniref:LLM class flavin-dependent oxidoreductase n=1 Tax=Tectimicrobiota bacterium TaxID=2528274 RepID=A0A938B6W2_UNCTE|nr:LLM class flavin-dependent oxidoreductase [Candidatus Tectomicrobia bacterium]
MSALPAFGLNRFNYTSPPAFAADAQRAERLGWDYAFIPSSPLRRQDPYVHLAFAAVQTERLGLGPLIETPMMRHPAVIASSIATVECLAPGRAILGYGVGDTAVRLMGKRPARVAELEEATILTRRLLAGEEVDVNAARPARLQHALRVPVWIAAGGPRTLRMAGRVADGVFIRVGRHAANIRTAIEAVYEGSRAVGRNPDEVKIGLIFHTILTDDLERAALLSRSMAAGYYEYSPMLFDPPQFTWNGPPVEELKKHVWPDFHHAEDLEASGRVVSFLSDEVADAFAVYGTPAMIARQLCEVMHLGYRVDMIIPHPVPTPPPGGPRPDYIERFATEVIPLFRAEMAQHATAAR